MVVFDKLMNDNIWSFLSEISIQEKKRREQNLEVSEDILPKKAVLYRRVRVEKRGSKYKYENLMLNFISWNRAQTSCF